MCRWNVRSRSQNGQKFTVVNNMGLTCFGVDVEEEPGESNNSEKWWCRVKSSLSKSLFLHQRSELGVEDGNHLVSMGGMKGTPRGQHQPGSGGL